MRYWLTPKPDPAFDAKCADICDVYKAAAGADDTHRTISIDEMTGIQALERIAPGLPMVPGKVERREFEYKRHGTQTLIAAFDVATGKVEGVVGNTRTEKDFARFLRRLLSCGTPNTRWDFVCDNLNIHLSSRSFVSLPAPAASSATSVARASLACSLPRRPGRPSCSTRTIASPPLHSQACLMAQPSGIWFSILVRKLLRRGDFVSKRDLRTKIEKFIAYFNATMAKPFRWTMAAKPLTG